MVGRQINRDLRRCFINIIFMAKRATIRNLRRWIDAQMGLFIELIDGDAGTEALKALMEKAKKEHSFVIHFGI